MPKSNFKYIFFVIFALSFAFAQDGAIKFEMPPKQEPQKLGVTANRPLNLAEISAKDTASFDTYSKRRDLVQDSISAMYKEIENSKKITLAREAEPKLLLLISQTEPNDSLFSELSALDAKLQIMLDQPVRAVRSWKAAQASANVDYFRKFMSFAAT